MVNPVKVSEPRQAATPAPRAPKLLSADERWGGSFLSRLKELLAEGPVRIAAVHGRLPFTSESPRAAFVDKLKTALQGEPAAAVGAESSPLLIQWGSSWGNFLGNLRDLVSPPKLPPLKVSGAPASPPKEIWTKDENAARSQWLSGLVHAVIVLLLALPLLQEVAIVTTEAGTPKVIRVDAGDLSDYLARLPKGNNRAGGGGGGGDRNPVPASKGKLPKTSLEPPLAPPMVAILNPAPILPVVPTILMPPSIKLPQPNLPNLGDPMANTLTNSNGPGSRGGIGTGNDGGVGPGSGPGVGPGDGGGFGNDRFRAGSDGIGEPVCIYCPQPPYTEEARKARFQGTVMLAITILPDGTPTEVRVVRGLGMGLDENAIQQVRQWRFKPVIGPGNRPVTVDLDVEINFRLL